MPSPPRISGTALRALSRAARTKVGAAAIYRLLRSDLRIDELAKLGDGLRGAIPLDTRPLMARPPRERRGRLDAPPRTDRDTWPTTSETLTRAYRSGEVTPLTVAKR